MWEKFVCIRRAIIEQREKFGDPKRRKETVFSDVFLASGGIKPEQTSAPLSCVYRGFLDYRCNRRPRVPWLVLVLSSKIWKSWGTFRLENEKFTFDEIFDIAESMMDYSIPILERLSIETCFNCIDLHLSILSFVASQRLIGQKRSSPP